MSADEHDQPPAEESSDGNPAAEGSDDREPEGEWPPSLGGSDGWLLDPLDDPVAVGATRLLAAARRLAGSATRPTLFIDHLRQPVAAAAFGSTEPGEGWTTCVIEGGPLPLTMLEAAGSAIDLIDLIGWEELLDTPPAMVVAVTETDDAAGMAVAVQHPDGHRSWSETGIVAGARLDGAARALEQAADDCLAVDGPAADDPRFCLGDDPPPW